MTYYACILNVSILLTNIIITVYPFGACRIFGDLLMMTGMGVSKAVNITASLGIIVGVTHVVEAFFCSGAYFIFVAIWVGVLIVKKSLDGNPLKSNDGSELRLVLYRIEGVEDGGVLGRDETLINGEIYSINSYRRVIRRLCEVPLVLALA